MARKKHRLANPIFTGQKYSATGSRVSPVQRDVSGKPRSVINHSDQVSRSPQVNGTSSGGSHQLVQRGYK